MSFWNTGEVGRFDPAAKAWKVWSLPDSKEGCYAVFVDDKDKVWLSDWTNNAIVRFDPVTEKFDSFPSNRSAPTCGNCSAARANYGPPNPAPTGWWWCGSEDVE